MTQVTRRRKARAGDEPSLPTRAQRVAAGKAARQTVPRAGHAEFSRIPGRPDPLALLQRQDTVRVPELLPIRYGRMAVSPFTYFRGAALPMAADLADTPSSGLSVQACGDAHMANFGLFASPERRLVFDINDFDETLPGPWEWDVKRLAASLEIAGRDNGYRAGQRQDIVVSAVAAYRQAMREFAELPTLQVWYAMTEMEALQARLAPQLDRSRRKNLARTVSKARTKDHLGALDRFVEISEGLPRIVADPPLITPIRDLVGEDRSGAEVERGLRDILSSYRASLEPERRALLDQYRLVDMARKVVGVGSVGTRAYMVLLHGGDLQDPLFLQAKEAGPSALEEFVGPSAPRIQPHVRTGHRCVRARICRPKRERSPEAGGGDQRRTDRLRDRPLKMHARKAQRSGRWMRWHPRGTKCGSTAGFPSVRAARSARWMSCRSRRRRSFSGICPI